MNTAANAWRQPLNHPQKKILLADDNLSFVRMLKESLELDGYEVLCGFDGSMTARLALNFLIRALLEPYPTIY